MKDTLTGAAQGIARQDSSLCVKFKKSYRRSGSRKHAVAVKRISIPKNKDQRRETMQGESIKGERTKARRAQRQAEFIFVNYYYYAAAVSAYGFFSNRK